MSLQYYLASTVAGRYTPTQRILASRQIKQAICHHVVQSNIMLKEDWYTGRVWSHCLISKAHVNVSKHICVLYTRDSTNFVRGQDFSRVLGRDFPTLTAFFIP